MRFAQCACTFSFLKHLINCFVVVVSAAFFLIKLSTSTHKSMKGCHHQGTSCHLINREGTKGYPRAQTGEDLRNKRIILSSQYNAKIKLNNCEDLIQ